MKIKNEPCTGHLLGDIHENFDNSESSANDSIPDIFQGLTIFRRLLMKMIESTTQ